jgi:hypothetical protein
MSGCGALGRGRSGRFVVLEWIDHESSSSSAFRIPSSAPIAVGHGAGSTLPQRHGAAAPHGNEPEAQDTSATQPQARTAQVRTRCSPSAKSIAGWTSSKGSRPIGRSRSRDISLTTWTGWSAAMRRMLYAVRP